LSAVSPPVGVDVALARQYGSVKKHQRDDGDDDAEANERNQWDDLH